MRKSREQHGMLTFGGHLEVFRWVLIRSIGVVLILTIIIFCFKQETFSIVLAPAGNDFITFRLLEKEMALHGWDFHFADLNIELINTDLSSQFMTHVTTSCMLGVLLASPFLLYEVFGFIAPALYDHEKKYSALAVTTIYLLFMLGVLISYFILFPISYRFLATYQVDESIRNTITLDSYISTFTTLLFMMGLVFQLPVITYFLGKIGVIDATTLRHYRPYTVVLIMIVAAFITPPDIFTLIMVALPIYALYELSILIIAKLKRN